MNFPITNETQASYKDIPPKIQVAILLSPV